MRYGLMVFIEALNSVKLCVEVVDIMFINEGQHEIIEAFSFNFYTKHSAKLRLTFKFSQLAMFTYPVIFG